MKPTREFLLLVCALLAGCNRTPQPNVNPAVGMLGADSTVSSVPRGSSDLGASRRGFYPDSLVETVLLHADGDGSPDSIRLYRALNWDYPGDFHFIEFTLGKSRRKLFQEKGGWVFFRNALDTSAFQTLRTMSVVNSQSLFATRLDSVSCTIMLFGYQYASSPGLFTVLTITGDSIRETFNSELAVDSIGDVDADGIPDVIGCHYEEVWGSDFVQYTSYNPWQILSLQTLRPAREETVRKYNEEHYYGSPPVGSSEPYLIVHLPHRKPFIMSEEEAYAKYGR